MFEVSLSRAFGKQATVFTFLVLWLILAHIFGQRKVNACCSVFVFCWGTSNAICDLVLYLLYEGLSISLMYDGTVLLQCLKAVIAMQDLTLPDTGSQLIFLKWITPKWAQGVNLNKDACIGLVLTGVS